MAKKLRLTRLELKRQRDMLARFERFLPTLKLKQQQLQAMLVVVEENRRAAQGALDCAQAGLDPYRAVLSDVAGVNVAALARPASVRTTPRNIAGVEVPVFAEIVWPPVDYSLFSTPPWVDRALRDLREISSWQEKLAVLRRQEELLRRELTRILQRVNLFEKVKIPESRDAIRRIRIHLGDEMTAAVVRAKIAKGKLQETSPVSEGPVHVEGPGE